MFPGRSHAPRRSRKPPSHRPLLGSAERVIPAPTTKPPPRACRHEYTGSDTGTASTAPAPTAAPSELGFHLSDCSRYPENHLAQLGSAPIRAGVQSPPSESPITGSHYSNAALQQRVGRNPVTNRPAKLRVLAIHLRAPRITQT